MNSEHNFLLKLSNFSSSWTGTIIIVLFFIFFVAQAFVIPSGSKKNSLLIGDFLFVKKFSYGMPTPHIPWLEVPVAPDFNGNGHLWEGKRPQRGDIVVFRYPNEPKIYYVKRLFAVSGDEVIFAPRAMYLRPNMSDDEIRKTYGDENLFKIGGKFYVREPYKNLGIHYDSSERKDNFGGQEIDIFSIATMFAAQGRFAMSAIFAPELAPLDGLDFNAFYFKVKEDEFFMVGDNRENSNDSRFWGPINYKHVVGKPWFVYFSWDGDKKEVRWDRVGRFVDSLESDERYINASK